MPFPQINTKDQNLQLIQSNVSTALQTTQNNPTNGSGLLPGTTLKAGQDNLVPHKLGKNLQFWTLGNIDTNATVWSPKSSQLNNMSSNSKYVNLRCSSDCIVTLMVG